MKAKTIKITKIPGIAFAEWGPGDMGMAFGFPDAHDPPYPKEMDMARDLIKLECDKNGMAFYSSWKDPSMSEKDQLKYAIQVVGARIVMVESMELATFARSLKE